MCVCACACVCVCASYTYFERAKGRMCMLSSSQKEDVAYEY